MKHAILTLTTAAQLAEATIPHCLSTDQDEINRLNEVVTECRAAALILDLDETGKEQPEGFPETVDDLPTDLLGAVHHVRNMLAGELIENAIVSKDGLLGIGHYLDCMIAREHFHRHHAGDAASH